MPAKKAVKTEETKAEKKPAKAAVKKTAEKTTKAAEKKAAPAKKETVKKAAAKKETVKKAETAAKKPAAKKAAEKKAPAKKAAVKKVAKPTVEKKSVQHYEDVINWKKGEAHAMDWLYIEINAGDLLTEVEAGVDNLESACNAMLNCMLEGDGFMTDPDVENKVSADLTVRYYCDNLSEDRKKYFDR